MITRINLTQSHSSPMAIYSTDVKALPKFNNVVSELIDIAATSSLNYKLAACIMKGKKKVAPSQVNTLGEGERGSRHAELRAMLSFCKNIKFRNGWHISDDLKKRNKNLGILVIRVLALDAKHPDKLMIGNARPCHKCLEMMKELGFGYVHYSDDNGDIITEKISRMVSVQSSFVAIKIDFIKKCKEKITRDTNICKLIDKQLYYDNVIKKYVPTQVREVNLTHFITYNIKNIPANYKFIYSNKKVTIVNDKDEVIKTIDII